MADPADLAQPSVELIYRAAPANGAARELRLEIHLPRAEPCGTVLYLHPGGFLGGGRNSVRQYVPEITARGLAVVAPDYRMAKEKPELAAPFAALSRRLRKAVPDDFALPPRFSGRAAHAATEDGLAALRWIAEAGGDFGLDAGRLLLMGDSAGGIVAANIAFLLPALGLERPPLAAVAILSGALPNVAMCDLGRGPALMWLHARRDARVNAASAEVVGQVAAGRTAPTDIRILGGRAHGTALFRKENLFPGDDETQRRAVLWDFLAAHRDANPG